MKKQMPCPECGGNKWKTVEKNKRYQCRQMIYDEVKGVGKLSFIKTRKLVPCGYVREL